MSTSHSLRLALPCAIFPVLAVAQVTSTPDRFTGETSLTTNLHAAKNVPLRPQVRVTIKRDGKFKDGLIMLVGAYPQWKYLKCYDTNWLLDGRPITLPRAIHDGEIGDGYVVDGTGQAVTLADLKKFAAAKKVEFEVCKDAGEFSADELNDLRELVSQVK